LPPRSVMLSRLLRNRFCLLLAAAVCGCQDPEVTTGKVPARLVPFEYTAPEDWQRVPVDNLTFEVADGDETAKFTASSLAGGAGGVEANIARWKRQAGLGEDGPKPEVTEIKVSGQPAFAVDLIGKDKRILGVILPRGEKTWFFKMEGPPDLVGKQKPAFHALVRSIRFAQDQGAPDGQ
jgi:hypothetical protein